MERQYRTLITIVIAATLLIPLSVQAQGPTEQVGAIVLHAAGRGNPWINLQDGRTLPTTYAGPSILAEDLQRGRARPLWLAAADLDEDGVPDLVSGYAGAQGGILTWQRGNLDALWPNTPEAQARKASGAFTDAPFLSPARVLGVPAAPDLMGAGDFDADGHWDIVAAARGGEALYLLPGDGKGGLGAAQAVKLPGKATALVVGEINRRDGLDDVVVSISGKQGPKVLVFEGPRGALRSTPEVIAVPSQVSALALGQVDEHYAVDLVVAAEQELLIVHGRDRQLSLDANRRAGVKPAQVSRHRLAFTGTAIALGDLAPDEQARYRVEAALLGGDGIVHVLDPMTGQEITQYAIQKGQEPSHATQLVRVKVSSVPGDELAILDPANQQIHIVMTGAQEYVHASGARPEVNQITLDVVGKPVALLPMRLNVDALNDLVILKDGPAGLTVGLTAPMSTYVVNSSGDEPDADPDDGVCSDCYRDPSGNCLRDDDGDILLNGVCSLGAASALASGFDGADAITFNISGGGVHTISRETSYLFTDPVTIDGYTQPGSSPNTNPVGLGLNTVLMIKVGGPSAIGITCGAWCVIRGLATAAHIKRDSIVEGNLIGTNVTGTQGEGLLVGLNVDSADNLIGGSTPQARNLIAGLGFQSPEGVPIGGNMVRGNLIGTDITGSRPLGNRGGVGFGISSAGANLIGGTIAGSRNVISGNPGYGVGIGKLPDGGTTLVQGNLIGTDVTGAVSVPNGTLWLGDKYMPGVSAYSGGVTIGGTGVRAGNLISGNFCDGIAITGGPQIDDGSLVQGNLIGTDVTGELDMGNGCNGVSLDNWSDKNTIGGTVDGARNTIAFNRASGVTLAYPYDANYNLGNVILGNALFANTGLGIDLCTNLQCTDGVTPNDPGDGDTGANNLQNYPVLTSVTGVEDDTIIQGTLNSTANTTFRLEFFSNTVCDASGYGEGQTFLGAKEVTTDANGNANFTVTFSGTGTNVTATATDPNGNTSEFSKCLGGLIVNSTGDKPDQTEGDGVCDTGGTIPGGDPECTLRAAIQEANKTAGGDTIGFNIPGASIPTIKPKTELPPITDPVVLDATTQPAGRVELDGSQAGTSNDVDGLEISAGNSTVKGFVINRFEGAGIHLRGKGNNVIVGNYIGTDQDGNCARVEAKCPLGNRRAGILVRSRRNQIGGKTAATRNVIASNRYGIRIEGGAGNYMWGNLIGTASNGTDPLGNELAGIIIVDNASRNQIGGLGTDQGNAIANNGADGVLIESGTENLILANRIYANGKSATEQGYRGLGIDLGNDGVTGNDDGDGDGGPNQRQNFPLLASGAFTQTAIITGTLNSQPNQIYTLEFFASPECHPSGHGEGKTFLGSRVVETNQNGNKRFIFQADAPPGSHLTATATDAHDNTSEFSPCAARLGVKEIEFQHQKYPTNNWVQVPPGGTIDGNTVRIVAKIENDGFTDWTAEVQFYDAETNQLLRNGRVRQLFPMGRTTRVELEWDTSGYAWDYGKPHLTSKIKVVVVDGAVEFDSEEKEIKVLPKPVILVHGWWSNHRAWSEYPAFLQQAHPDWKGFAVGDGQAEGKLSTGTPLSFGKSIPENAKILDKYIEGVRGKMNAWHVDLVAHSKGGLIARQYIHSQMTLAPNAPDGKPDVSHLVMLGTPNLGSPCANLIPGNGAYELRPSFVESFNRAVYNKNKVAFSILAGVVMLITCYSPQEGDSVVAKNSAFGLGYVKDRGLTDTWHTDMTASQSDLASFVKPRLAVGPIHTRATSQEGEELTLPDEKAAVPDAERRPPQLLYTKFVQLAASGTHTIDLAVPAGTLFAVTLAAPASIGSTLRDPAGNVVGTIPAGSKEAAQYFRTLRVENPTVGKWKLELDNSSAAAKKVAVSAWIEGNPLLLTYKIDKPTAERRVKVTATIKREGAPVTNAQVTAKFKGTNGAAVTIKLFDDGQHGDGQPADGIYAGTTAPLAAGGYVILITAKGKGFTRATTAAVEIPQ